MKEVIDFILNKELSLSKQLKKSIPLETKENILLEKQQLKDLLFLIEIYEKYDLSKKNIGNIIELPQNATDISEYRIVDDCDTENKEFWKELKNIRLKNGDIIIKKKNNKSGYRNSR